MEVPIVRSNIPSAARIRRLPNYVDRIDAAKRAMDRHLEEVSALAFVRAEAALLLRQKHSVAEIADLLGVTPDAVYKMMRNNTQATSAVQEILASTDQIEEELGEFGTGPLDNGAGMVS